MGKRFSLIKSEIQHLEKRIFPRFPFTFLIFKGKKRNGKNVFEVRDISYTGMQLSLKDGEHKYVPGNKITGTIHWNNAQLEINGKVKWVQGSVLGVAFDKQKDFRNNIINFLSIRNVMANIRPLHLLKFDFDIPSNLKYWLQADGPCEIFIWQHRNGELSRFQIIYFDQFVEWENGKGLITGSIVSKRDLETPLNLEDEFIFQIDEGAKYDRIKSVLEMISHVSDEHLPQEVQDFLKVKLGR